MWLGAWGIEVTLVMDELEGNPADYTFNNYLHCLHENRIYHGLRSAGSRGSYWVGGRDRNMCSSDPDMGNTSPTQVHGTVYPHDNLAS